MFPLARTFLLLLALVAGSPAFAGELLLPPLTADASVNARQRDLVNDTLASELELQPGFVGVVRLPTRPSLLTSTCLRKAKCLGRIAESNGAESLVAGSVRRRGRLFWLELVFFDRNQLVRQGTWSVPTDPTALADALGPVVRELVTGRTDAEAAPAISDVEFEDFEDFEDPDPPASGSGPAEEMPEINFGAAEVQTAPLSDDDEELPDEADILADDSPRALPPPVERDRDAERELRRRQKEREREDARRDRMASRAERPPPGERPHIVQITARGGFSKYYAFNFLTAGGEVAVRAADRLHFIAGVEVYGVNLEYTPEEQLEFGQLRYWDAVFPIHFGFLYEFPVNESVKPYAGLEIILAQYFIDDVGADWAGGPRLRGGVDWMIAENFGLNFNVALGGWLGQNWPFIDPRLRRVGLLPQATVGPLVSF